MTSEKFSMCLYWLIICAETLKRPAFVVRRAFQVSELWFHSSHSTQRRSGKEHEFLAIGLQTYG